ncbi:MAG TPA: serine hydrolase domain-containing protein [Flavisolibacter sp.]|nr:serine hydrolase domain-containing protein [Flavisolibacter sp.]
MSKAVSLFSFFLLCAIAVVAQTKSATLQAAPPETAGFSAERLKRIDTMLTGWVERGRTNGAVALIARNGKIIYHKAFGFDDPEKKDPIRTDDIYRIASQTKAITSVAAMMLYEEGKFLLDDPLSRYIPEFAKPVVLDKFKAADSTYTTTPAKSEITIRQLLTHTSGIGYAQIGSREANAIYAKAGITAGIGTEGGHLLATDIRKLGKLPLMHQPGERWTYGLNTDVLGYLVEVLSGTTLDEFFRKRIFEPLGMKDTYFNVPAAKHNRVVNLYVEQDKKLQKAPPSVNQNGVFITDYPKAGTTYFSGGAGLSSTALDYAIFLQMMLNGGTYNGKQILSRNTVRLMTMNQIGEIDFGLNKMGLGFGITTEKGSAKLPTPAGVFEWGGAFSTTYWADPKEGLVGILYRQLWSTTHWEASDKFKVLVYSAIAD